MNKERYNQIIDEVYNKYTTKSSRDTFKGSTTNKYTCYDTTNEK